MGSFKLTNKKLITFWLNPLSKKVVFPAITFFYDQNNIKLIDKIVENRILHHLPKFGVIWSAH